VFTSERGTPFTTAGLARMIERAGIEAGFGFKAHPHTLRHACGYVLVNKGHDTRALQAYLGHRNIHHRSLHRDVADAVQGLLARLIVTPAAREAAVTIRRCHWGLLADRIHRQRAPGGSHSSVAVPARFQLNAQS
jgi:integrase